MEPSLFNFNTYSLQLSSPPPLSSQIMSLSAVVQGVTRIDVDYNLLNFPVKPYKIVLNWPFRAPVAVNDVFITNSVIDPLSTFSPANSALSYTVVVPKSVEPATYNAQINIYYENGIIHYFNVAIIAYCDNLIDLDLNVLDVQNGYIPFTTVYNLQSNRDNMLYNSTDVFLE